MDGDRSMDCDRSLGGSTTCMACHPNMTLKIDGHCATPPRPSGKTPAGAPPEAVGRGGGVGGWKYGTAQIGYFLRHARVLLGLARL